MPLFKNTNDDLQLIEETPFKMEKEIQNICEKNLNKLLRIDFIKSEFKINEFRIDSLAFDSKLKAFIIIEYKRERNFSVIDQGYTYLSLMLNNKADFILEYNESGFTNENLNRNEVDWSQSKVVFIAPSFTNYQKEAINFKDLPIELWEIKQFSNNTISFNQITTKGAIESIQTISKTSDIISEVSKQVKVYSEDYHITNGKPEIQELYNKLKTYILNIADDIKINPTKTYIGFISSSNFCDITIQKKSIKIWINLKKGQLDDHKKIAKDVSGIGHYGNGDYEISISNDNELEYIISLIKDGYTKLKK